MGLDPQDSEESVRIRVRNRFVLFLFGWGMFPEYAEAEHGLWWQWLRKGR